MHKNKVSLHLIRHIHCRQPRDVAAMLLNPNYFVLYSNCQTTGMGSNSTRENKGKSISYPWPNLFAPTTLLD